MGDFENGTLGTQEQPVEQAQETQETKPEFWLDENGNVQGDFSDFVKDEETQKTAETPETQKEPEQEETKYYTKEEIEQIGIDKLDPNRIPPELVPFYKSMQADYTRKTQALAEERKIVEKVLDKALSHPELAKEFLSDPEMVAAAQRHPELAQKLQAVSQMAQPRPKSQLDIIVEQAKQLVEQELGEEFDEFDPRHIAAFNLKVQEVHQQFARMQAAQQKLAQVQASEPHFAEIDAYAEQKLAQMPYAEAKKIEQALANGDIDTVLQFWEECRKEWYNKNVAQPQQTQQTQTKAPTPPAVEQSGQGQVETRPSISPEDFANMSEDEKTQALIKLGLVD